MSSPAPAKVPSRPPRPRLLFDPSLCTGCRICQLACAARLHGGYNPAWAAISIDDCLQGLGAEATVCRQCSRPYCAMVCPPKCVSEPDGEVVVVDRARCNGCGLCEKYCPWGGIKVREGKADKCDLCGLDPECVKQCPTNALRLVGGG